MQSGEKKNQQDNSDESFNSDLNTLKTNCEDIFNIEKSSSKKENINPYMMYKMGTPIYNQNLSKSFPNFFAHKNSEIFFNRNIPQTQHFRYKKTAMDYLKEFAEQESTRIDKSIYEKNSFSSENINLQLLKKLRRKKRDKKKERDLNYYGRDLDYHIPIKKKKKEKKPKPQKKNVVIVEGLSNENEAFESFADFSDDMFSSKIKNDVRVFCCAFPTCDVELPSLSRIKRHYLVHTNFKPFKCLKCSKRFSRKDNMLQHYRTHCKNRKRNS